jgi:hypothetical protein
MENISQPTSASGLVDTYTGPRLFGAPVGDFGFFQTLLFIFATTVGSFLLGTFVGIFVLLIVLMASSRQVNFADSYLYVGLPVGILAFLFSLIYLGGIYIRRVLSGKRNR